MRQWLVWLVAVPVIAAAATANVDEVAELRKQLEQTRDELEALRSKQPAPESSAGPEEEHIPPQSHVWWTEDATLLLAILLTALIGFGGAFALLGLPAWGSRGVSEDPTVDYTEEERRQLEYERSMMEAELAVIHLVLWYSATERAATQRLQQESGKRSSVRLSDPSFDEEVCQCCIQRTSHRAAGYKAAAMWEQGLCRG